MTTVKWLLIVAFAGYAGIAALMYVFQRSLLYFPDRARTAPAAAGLPRAQEIALTSADGERLVAWFIPPQQGKPLVIYFHGNAGALNLRAERFGKLTSDGTGLIGLSYRGYGGSSGSPSEAGLIADARAAYDYAAARVPAQRIVLFGESLGTAVAVALAGEKPVAGLILDAPFTSAVEVGASIYWFLPVRYLMKDSFRSDLRIGKVTAPLLIMHGERDAIMPIRYAEALYAMANEPKEFVRYAPGGHVNLDAHGATETVRAFLGRLR